MSKKVFADDIKEKEKEKEKAMEEKEKNKTENKDASDGGGASGFSDEAEKKFQEKKKGKMAKLHSVVEKGLIPPKGNQPENKGKWSDLIVRVKWSCLMASLYFLILFSGHFYSAVMVALIVVSIFYELIDIPRFKERNSEVHNIQYFTIY